MKFFSCKNDTFWSEFQTLWCLGTLQSREPDDNCSSSCMTSLTQDLCYVAQLCCDSWYNQSRCILTAKDNFTNLNLTQKQMLKAKENWVGCEYDSTKANQTCGKLIEILRS